MQEPTFASLEFEQKKRQTRRERFLERLDALVPWTALEARVEPVYPKPGRGRRPYPLAVMLRVHCVQLCYNLSDPAMEDLLYEAESVRRFCGLNLSSPIPDESTILHFRHLLERHQLGAALLETINAHLAGQGLRLQAGTIVDASIIAAPSSTKNQARARDPEMHQTRKGNEWHFGMKLHIGVDAISGLTHSLSTTAANTADVTEAHRLLHGAEREAWGDAGCRRTTGSRCASVPAGQGRASLPLHQTSLRIRQGALSRPSQEPQPTGALARPDQPADRRAATGLALGDLRPPLGLAPTTAPIGPRNRP